MLWGQEAIGSHTGTRQVLVDLRPSTGGSRGEDSEPKAWHSEAGIRNWV